MTCTCERYVPNPNAPHESVIARRDVHCAQHGDTVLFVKPTIMRMRSDVHKIRDYAAPDEVKETLAAIESTLDELLAAMGDER